MTMILGAFIEALRSFTIPEMWLFMGIGTILGLTLGIIPGVGPTLGLVVVFPFLFVMAPDHALWLMVAILSVVYIGGSITAILLNVPGTPGNAATLIDGFPMAQKGEGGRALGAALASCGFGSIITTFVVLAMVPLVLPMVMALQSSEMVFVILFGLIFIAILGSGAIVKGLISGVAGLLLGFVGFQDSTAVPRFTFGSLYIYDGIPMLPVVLGLFCVPEMIALATTGGTIAKTGMLIKGMQDVWRGINDVFRHWWLSLRSSLIGFVCGVIPGVGAMVATFVAYSHARQTSRHSESFGTGCVEGVIAPECANDAKEGGALLTTLALGIPGSGHQALLLAAIILLGLEPGPAMMTHHLDLSLSLVMIILVASVIGVALCIPFAPHFAKIAYVPGRILVPLVVIITIIGAFAYQQLFNDVIAVLVLTMLGLAMRKFDYNRPALFLGYLLGPMFEKYFFLALKTAGPLFFLRPISLVLIFITIATVSFGPIKSLFRRWKRRKKEISWNKPRKEVRKIRGDSYAFIGVMVVMLTVIVSSLMMKYFASKLLPLLMSSFGFVLATIGLAQKISTRDRGEIKEDERDEKEPAIETWRGYALNLLWIGGFVLISYLMGFIIAIPLFVVSYMRWLGTRWRVATISALLMLALIYGVFELAIGIDLYRGIIFT